MPLLKYPLKHMRNNVYHYWSAWRRAYLRKVFGMHIGKGTRISSKARLDYTNPKGVYIGDHTTITFDVAILTHDFVNLRHVDTHVGNYCFVGTGSILMPGVRIGDHCIVGAGSVVTRDVPPGCIVAGNPARIQRTGISTRAYGILDPEQPGQRVTDGAEASDPETPAPAPAAAETKNG